jgi:hypothetical protein
VLKDSDSDSAEAAPRRKSKPRPKLGDDRVGARANSNVIVSQLVPGQSRSAAAAVGGRSWGGPSLGHSDGYGMTVR